MAAYRLEKEPEFWIFSAEKVERRVAISGKKYHNKSKTIHYNQN